MSHDLFANTTGVPPHKASYVQDLCILVPQPVWEYLHNLYGGGPVCNRLYICATCQVQQERIENKRKQELDMFVKVSHWCSSLCICFLQNL